MKKWGEKTESPSPVLPCAMGFEFRWVQKGLNLRVIWKGGSVTGHKLQGIREAA